jgi:hypothetical protein
MDDDRETTIRSVAEALVSAMVLGSDQASHHLAQLVALDKNHGMFWLFADALTQAMRGGEVNTKYLKVNDIYLLMQAAARRLVNSGE